jgi:hypothetical protein
VRFARSLRLSRTSFLQILRPPSDAAALAAALASRLAAAEQCQVGKLDTIYSAAAAAAESRDPTVQEGELRRRIAAYFEAVGGTECLPPPQLVRGCALAAAALPSLGAVG